jgi:hypothetical protein
MRNSGQQRLQRMQRPFRCLPLLIKGEAQGNREAEEDAETFQVRTPPHKRRSSGPREAAEAFQVPYHHTSYKEKLRAERMQRPFRYRTTSTLVVAGVCSSKLSQLSSTVQHNGLVFKKFVDHL